VGGRRAAGTDDLVRLLRSKLSAEKRGDCVLNPTDPFDIGRWRRYNNRGLEKGDTGYDAALIQKQFKIVTGHQGGSGFWTGAETELASLLPSSHLSLI
jgi:hypothetical protein